MRCSPPNRRLRTTTCSRACAPNSGRSSGIEPVAAAPVVLRPACAATSRTRSAGSASCGGSASAAAWPTTWASARPSWCWRCSRRAGTGGAARRRAVARRRAALARLQLDRRSEALRARTAGVRLHGAAARRCPGSAKADLVLTTYGTMRRDAPKLRDIEFDYVILDEAQAIKNAATASAKAARLLRARHRLALSGTPIENHLGELWSLFEFLNPGLLGSARRVPARAFGPAARWATRTSSGSRAPCARSSCGARKTRSRPSCRSGRSRRFTASWSRPSGGSTTSCARTIASRC